MADAVYMSGDEVLADSMATTAFNHYMGCVQWYKTMYHPSSDIYFKKDQIAILYSIVEQYERESLISVWATRCFYAGVPLE